jgi:hypothetical protein
MDAPEIQFMNALKLFINEIDDGSDEIIKIKSLFEKIDIKKISERFVKLLTPLRDKIKNKDISIFNETFMILPNVNLSRIWKSLTDEKKERVWLFITLFDMLSSINAKNDVDPIYGVGQDAPISVDDFRHNLTVAEQSIKKEDTDPISMILGKLGIKNLSEITDELKNIDKTKIDTATTDMKKLLGITDTGTGDFISKMIGSIADELRDTDLTKGNQIENFMKIAETVASKMRPEIENGNVDINSLLNSTQSLANKMNGNTDEFINQLNDIKSQSEPKTEPKTEPDKNIKKNRHKH